MPILQRLHDDDDKDDAEKRKPHKPAPDPEVIKGRYGHASFSLAALAERIMAQVQAELDSRDDILLAERDEAARRQLVREAGEYVLAVESVPLQPAEKEALFAAVFSEMFRFGPLDALIADDAVTELTINGFDTVHIRRGSGEPQAVKSHFEDYPHLLRILGRMVTSSDGQLLADVPFLELGLTMLGRPARMSLVLPPYTPLPQVVVRLHPAETMTLDRQRDGGALSEVDRAVLAALLRGEHGVMIAGDPAAGKTMLLEALLDALPVGAGAWVVERARELRLPESMQRLSAVPPTEEHPAGEDFAAQILAALDAAPNVLVLDEVRGDEAAALWAALAADARLLLTLRSSIQPARLRSAFHTVLRKAKPNQPDTALDDLLLARLPFLLAMDVREDGPRLVSICEWRREGDTLALIPLVDAGQITGAQPDHPLAVPEGFWRV